MVYFTPFIAIALTIFTGAILFSILGKDPLEAMTLLFISPFQSLFSIGELLVKATPLILIAIGLSFGFRAGIWNIGAEGQFVIGALCSGSVALMFYEISSIWVLPLMCFAGMLGGLLWAAIPAFLRIKFNANEILVSLMLSYVAILLLSAMVHGPLKSPDGYNFPESRLFHDAAIIPILIKGTRAHIGFIITIIVAGATLFLLNRHVLGYQIKLYGQAVAAARFAGFSEKRIVAFCLLFSGALAGLAGTFEVSGPVGQLVPSLAIGYGYTAIIVTFLGNLHPIGIVGAGFVMAITYVGGEAVQVSMNLPSSVISVFQGMLLFYLLGVQFLIKFQLSWHRASPPIADQTRQEVV